MSESDSLAVAEAQRAFDDMQPQAITDDEIIDLFVAFKMQRIMDIQQQEGKKKNKTKIENDPENLRMDVLFQDFCYHLVENYSDRLGALNQILDETKDIKFVFDVELEEQQ